MQSCCTSYIHAITEAQPGFCFVGLGCGAVASRLPMSYCAGWRKESCEHLPAFRLQDSAIMSHDFYFKSVREKIRIHGFKFPRMLCRNVWESKNKKDVWLHLASDSFVFMHWRLSVANINVKLPWCLVTTSAKYVPDAIMLTLATIIPRTFSPPKLFLSCQMSNLLERCNTWRWSTPHANIPVRKHR